jgi:dimethylhistidine N-methyltransferase
MSQEMSPANSAFLSDVLDGLSRPRKSLPCKYFYDAIGVQLFDRICELESYYPTRTELAIMAAFADEMAALIGRGARLVELGSGSSTKTRILLDHARNLAAYVPVDISPDYLERARVALERAYPQLRVLPVCADYTQPFALPPVPSATRTISYFPGSTIGNFEPVQAGRFLQLIARICGPGGGLLIGVDLKKDARILNAAYNDPEGVTAAFNLNLLTRINRELGADFDLSTFRHRAFYDANLGRIEMQLVSDKAQTVRVGEEDVAFAAGEAICTEYSYKYGAEEFAHLAQQAGFVLRKTWQDAQALFSVHYFDVVASGGA